MNFCIMLLFDTGMRCNEMILMEPDLYSGQAWQGQQGTCGAKVACAVQAADEVSYPTGCLFKGISQSPQEPVSQQEREAFDG